MTSKVTIDAHAGHDIIVTVLDERNEPVAPPEVVAAGTERIGHVWQGRKLLIEEGPKRYG